jgi:Asp-tRNA(Asn)/Glu-tRNA(Gln) amidotransferase A subunit family amidase
MQLVNLYFKRIEAYNGTCVKGDADEATGLMLGDLTPIESAGQVNAYMTLNVRGRRSMTDKADNDPKMADALETARAQDAYFARTGEFVGPLHGVPIAVKDNYDTADMRTTAGAAAEYANDKPPTDATMVAKPRAAGAILLGKTNMDEYAPAGIARSSLGGQTCNPYDTKRIPGGSSAGSGAAIAANLAICALGTDTAGSVLLPRSTPSSAWLRPKVSSAAPESSRCRFRATAADRCAARCRIPRPCSRWSRAPIRATR